MIDRSVPRIVVYDVACNATGKHYIGITQSTVQRRWAGHIRHTRYTTRRATYLGRAILKYGADAFTVTEIAVCQSRADACLVEQWIIADRGTLSPNGYNMTAGGDGGCAKGRVFSAEHRRKLSIAASARKCTAEQCQAISNRLRGKVQSAETKEKRRLSNAGFRHSELTKLKLRQINKGKKLSAEACARIGDSKRGKVQSEATREKRAVALRGRKRPPEVGAKISATYRANWSIDRRDARSRSRFKLLADHPEIIAKISATKRAKLVAQAKG